MPSVQIKSVPDDVHAVLRRRAAAAHQSLQGPSCPIEVLSPPARTSADDHD